MPNNDEAERKVKVFLERSSLAGEEPPAHNQQLKKEKEINEIKSKAGEPRAAFDWFIWFH